MQAIEEQHKLAVNVEEYKYEYDAGLESFVAKTH